MSGKRRSSKRKSASKKSKRKSTSKKPTRKAVLKMYADKEYDPLGMLDPGLQTLKYMKDEGFLDKKARDPSNDILGLGLGDPLINTPLIPGVMSGQMIFTPDEPDYSKFSNLGLPGFSDDGLNMLLTPTMTGGGDVDMDMDGGLGPIAHLPPDMAKLIINRYLMKKQMPHLVSNLLTQHPITNTAMKLNFLEDHQHVMEPKHVMNNTDKSLRDIIQMETHDNKPLYHKRVNVMTRLD